MLTTRVGQLLTPDKAGLLHLVDLRDSGKNLENTAAHSRKGILLSRQSTKF